MFTVHDDPETIKTANVPRRISTDPSQDPRDPARAWAKLLPRQGSFTNPAAKLLAEFADAVVSEDGWEAWTAAHSDVDDVLPTEPDR